MLIYEMLIHDIIFHSFYSVAESKIYFVILVMRYGKCLYANLNFIAARVSSEIFWLNHRMY